MNAPDSRAEAHRSRDRRSLRNSRVSIRAVLVAGVVATLPLSPMAAFAQPQPQPQPQQPGAPNPDTMKEIARQRYNDGVKAYDAGKWDDARLAFSQSYELTKVPAVLLNLGMSEVRGGHTVEGGNHLLQFLREYKEAKPDQIATAQGGIEEAKKKSALVTITVNAPGADVSIDGALVGKSPINDPVFVAEGSRTVVASLNGASGMARIDAKKGTPATAAVVIQGAEPPPVAPVAPVGPMQPTQPMGPQPMQPVGPMGPNNNFQPVPDSSGESFGHWYTHKPLAWVGTGLAAVGLGLGIGFTAAAASANSHTESVADAIRAHQAQKGDSGPPCANGDGGGDLAGYETACSSLRDATSKHDVDVGVAVTGWVVFGLAAAGTVTYAMVDWYPKRKGNHTGSLEPVHIEPIVGPGYAGMRGSF